MDFISYDVHLPFFIQLKKCFWKVARSSYQEAVAHLPGLTAESLLIVTNLNLVIHRPNCRRKPKKKKKIRLHPHTWINIICWLTTTLQNEMRDVVCSVLQSEKPQLRSWARLIAISWIGALLRLSRERLSMTAIRYSRDASSFRIAIPGIPTLVHISVLVTLFVCTASWIA